MALSKQLVHLAGQNGWQIDQDENQVYGEYNGYLFTVIEGKGFKSFITSVAGISETALNELLTYLKDNSKGLRLRNFEAAENFLCVRQHDGLMPLSVDKMDLLLGQLSGLLDLYELPTDACIVCGQPAVVSGLYFGLLCTLHPDCESANMIYYTGEKAPESTPSEEESPESTPSENNNNASAEDALDSQDRLQEVEKHETN